MANITGGSVVWNFDVDSSKFTSGLAKASAESKGFAAELGGVNFSKFASSAQSAFNDVADSIANLGKKVAIAGIAGAALGGIFVKSAGDLQITSKSMEILVGNTQVANELFGQLATYANNTPFQFPDIAKGARTMLGFGIQVKDVMPDIKMLGDLAGVTGADFSSLALVFGQVNATGHLMGQDALQLINNNIPITTILAKKLGTSVQDVKKRMEEGAISADLFNQALLETTQQGGFAFQGADKLAQTFNGRLSTLKDAVMEFGRELFGVKVDPKLGLVVEPGGLFDKLSDLLPKITKSLQDMAPKFKAAFDFIVNNGNTLVAIVAGLAAAFVAMKVGSLISSIVTLGARFAFLTGMMGEATAAQWGFNVAADANPIGLIVTAIAAVIAALVFLQVRFGIFTKAWDGIKVAWEATVSFFKDHAEVFKKIMIGLAAIILLPVLPVIALTVLIVKNFGTIRDFIVSVFTTVYNFFVTVFTAIWNFISPILKFILDLYIIVFGAILIVILTVLTVIKDIIFAVWNAVWGFLQPIITGIWNFITTVFTAIKDTIVTIFTAVWTFISNIWNTIYNVISGVVTSIINFFAPALTWLFDKGKDIVNGLVNGIKAVAGAVWSAIKSVADQIGNFFAGAAGWLWDTGKAIVQGLVNGIKSMIGAVGDAAGSIASTVKNKVKGLLGINSPSKVFMEIGTNVGEGFQAGIDKSTADMKGVAQNMTGSINYTSHGLPTISDMAIASKASPIVNNIGEIHIASEVDGDNWLKKLTRDDVVTGAGLTSNVSV